MLTVLEEFCKCVSFEPVLEGLPRVRVDHKEDSTIVGTKCQKAKVQLASVATGAELVGWTGILVDEHLVDPAVLVAVHVIVHQAVLLFAAAKQATAGLCPFNRLCCRIDRSVSHHANIIHVKSLESKTILVG